MLNISLNSVSKKIDLEQFESYQILQSRSVSSWMLKILVGLGVLLFAFLFLPWTQNIRAAGAVTTVRPDQRPQSVQAVIGGRVEKWYVQEGATVKAGDTIMQISEVKEEYLDPRILENTQGQVDAKKSASEAYREKARNLTDQYQALVKSRDIKLEQNELKINQVKLKIQSNEADIAAAKANLDVAKYQRDRIKNLYDEGIKSLTDLEQKELKYQETLAKLVSLENKLNENKNELELAMANRAGILNEYRDKLAKSQSERQTALSNSFTAESDISKLQSQFNTYEQRQANYFITSPIDGIITEAIQSGIGELLKAGDDIVTIMPSDFELAVEIFVEPIDMPLLQKGQKVNIQFDGWPAIVFSGWPNSSFGTFVGRIFAIDNFISDNGKYRILVSPDHDAEPWPEAVRVGGGANSIILLNDVRVGYEIWRQLNGFPANFYEKNDGKEKDPKLKAPLRSVK